MRLSNSIKSNLSVFFRIITDMKFKLMIECDIDSWSAGFLLMFLLGRSEIGMLLNVLCWMVIYNEMYLGFTRLLFHCIDLLWFR